MAEVEDYVAAKSRAASILEWLLKRFGERVASKTLSQLAYRDLEDNSSLKHDGLVPGWYSVAYNLNRPAFIFFLAKASK